MIHVIRNLYQTIYIISRGALRPKARLLPNTSQRLRLGQSRLGEPSFPFSGFPKPGGSFN